MRIIAKRTLERYLESLEGYSDVDLLRSHLMAWHAEAKRATWTQPSEVKAQYRSASIVGDRVVFNIRGNHYRLVVAVDYEKRIIFVKWIGTHDEYDKIDVATVAYE